MTQHLHYELLIFHVCDNSKEANVVRYPEKRRLYGYLLHIIPTSDEF